MNEIERSFRPAPLDARHLRLVLAIVDEGGLTRAGERLNVTQSALSHQLRQIETSLGVPLFVRAKKRLVLTEAGEELVLRARAIVADMAALEDDLRQRASGWRGTLRIATECYTCYEWLPPLLKRFSRKHERVDVRIVAEATRHPIEALHRGDIDLAVITGVADDESLELHHLFDDELLLIASPEHRLAAKAFVRPADLAKERLLLYSPREESLFYRHFFGRTAPDVEVVSIQLTEAILSMVRANLGLTVAARWAVASELASGRVAGIRLGPSGYHRTWRAATRRTPSRPTPAYIADFISLFGGQIFPLSLSYQL